LWGRWPKARITMPGTQCCGVRATKLFLDCGRQNFRNSSKLRGVLALRREAKAMVKKTLVEERRADVAMEKERCQEFEPACNFLAKEDIERDDKGSK